MGVLRGDGTHSAEGREVLVPSDAARIVDGRGPGHPHGIVARRRSRFARLLIATAASLPVAIVAGGWLWAPFLVIASATGVYAVVLRHLKLQRDAARRVVSQMDRGTQLARPLPAQVAVGGSVSPASGSVRIRRWDD